MRKYSGFFKTLHDETAPTGCLGRGTHYSVFRAITFHNAVGEVLPAVSAQLQALGFDDGNHELI